VEEAGQKSTKKMNTKKKVENEVVEVEDDDE